MYLGHSLFFYSHECGLYVLFVGDHGNLLAGGLISHKVVLGTRLYIFFFDFCKYFNLAINIVQKKDKNVRVWLHYTH